MRKIKKGLRRKALKKADPLAVQTKIARKMAESIEELELDRLE